MIKVVFLCYDCGDLIKRGNALSVFVHFSPCNSVHPLKKNIFLEFEMIIIIYIFVIMYCMCIKYLDDVCAWATVLIPNPPPLTPCPE